MQVFVVLYSVVGPLLVRGGDIDRAAHEEVNGGLLTQHSQRIDSDQDPSMKVTLNGPFSMTSNLFRRCITESNSAIVRYHYLKFPKSGVEFTRYVPNADQQTLYDPKWQNVNKASLNTPLACATYAQTNKTAMMYQFVGSKCRVSTIRMPVRVPTCGYRNVNPVFIRTSCPEPTILGLKLTPDAGAMNITWTVNDPCNVSGGFQVKWVNVKNKDVAALNANVFYYRIKDRFGCETQNVTVTAVDSISLPWGNLSLASADTLSRGSPFMTTLTVDESVTFIHVSWTSDFNECLRINNYVMTWDSNTTTLGENVFEYNITGLHACQNITVTVKALYDNGSMTSNILSKPARTLPADPVIENFSATSLYDSITLNWTVRDHCDLLNGLKIRHGGATNNTLPKTSRYYKAEGLACNTSYSFDLVPINDAGAEFGSKGSLNATTTTLIGPPVMATLTVNESVTSVHVSWTSDSNECLRINNYVVTWDNGTETLGDNVFEYIITGLHACQNIAVTVKALYDDGSGTSNILSVLTRTLPEEYSSTMTTVVGQVRRLTSHSSYDGVSKYDNDMDRGFLIESPGVDTHVRIQFQAFITEEAYDFLNIFDGNPCSDTHLANLTGDLTGNLPTYTSTGRYMVLVFHTDYMITKPGWLLLYDAV